jgi:Ser/Thr protein kinase RdoA (MazF antagonist)
MDWLLVVLLTVQRPDGTEQTVVRREAVRSELACHTAIMRHLDTRGQRVKEAECIPRRGGAVRVAADTGSQPRAR